MTEQQIIEWARESNCYSDKGGFLCDFYSLKKLSALATAHERERCAKLENEAGVYTKNDMAVAIRALKD